MPRASIALEPKAHNVWEARVTYSQGTGITPISLGDTKFSFNTGGGTEHITHSLAHVGDFVVPGKTATDHKGAINVMESGVKGLDVMVAKFGFTKAKVFATAAVDTAYLGAVAALSATVNHAAFEFCAKGECLFQYATGSQRSDTEFEIVFHFLVIPNQTGRTIGDITAIAKEGWEYLWVEYDDVKDSSSGTLARRPREVHIEQIYTYGDFSALGL